MKFGYRHKQYSLLKKGTVIYIGPCSRYINNKPVGFIVKTPFRSREKDAYKITMMRKDGHLDTYLAQYCFAYHYKDNGDDRRYQRWHAFDGR